MSLLDRSVAQLVTALLIVAACAGCSGGSKSGEVHGKVTFKGQPVKEGRVTFANPTEGGGAEALIQSDGSYAVENPVPLGDYTITVNPLTELRDTDPGKTPPTKVEKAARDIPQKYRAPGSTPLKKSIVQGKNELNIEMQP